MPKLLDLVVELAIFATISSDNLLQISLCLLLLGNRFATHLLTFFNLIIQAVKLLLHHLLHILLLLNLCHQGALLLLVHFNLLCQLHRVIDRQLVIRHGTHPFVNFLLHDFTEQIGHSTSGLLLFFFLSILCLIVNVFALLRSFFLRLVLIFHNLFFLAFFLGIFLLLHHLIFQILLFSQSRAIFILQQLVLI